ncbi:hypothetical protein TRFO_38059 [Tritrichomonas foetus]|uniref:Uncharacterized protein n=1 Tax=Tritrichomonas foetus TaxID=1144522 RepID=A0A1J4J9E1_9EUKA|nr:hypothetical protein TRFO_38059 [Tritrichomonas foetus]|eukprot:OHS95810.1 hypothetical protein TRFO_38059 [Tritrichomonas foetus]
MTTIRFKVVSVDLNKSDQKNFRKNEALLKLVTNINPKGMKFCTSPSHLYILDHTFGIDDPMNQVTNIRLSIDNTNFFGDGTELCFALINTASLKLGQCTQMEVPLMSIKDRLIHGTVYLEIYATYYVPEEHPRGCPLYIRPMLLGSVY